LKQTSEIFQTWLGNADTDSSCWTQGFCLTVVIHSFKNLEFCDKKMDELRNMCF